MPYTMKSAPARSVLSGHALEIWVSAYNSASENVPSGRDADEYASRVAWSAVKKAGYRKGKDGKWHKAAAARVAEILSHMLDSDEGMEIEDTAVVAAAESSLRLLDRTEAMSMPVATPSKVYAEFKLISFGEGNKNKDGFDPSDVSDDVISTLEGSPIYVDDDASDHPEKNARATDRAQFQVGTVTQAERRDDGVYCVGAFQREFLEDRGISPESLPRKFSVSMEVTFDRAKARYRVGESVLSYREALAKGAAAPFGEQDDRNKYDIRFIVPTEFHAVALLSRGRNADPEADVLKVAASEVDDMGVDLTAEITWSQEDQDAYLAFLVVKPDEEEALGAKLTTEKRKALPRGAFAHVDEKGEGHLPIHDAAHVRNALARLNQTDIPGAEKRKALRKILAAAKRMGVKVDPDSPNVKAYSGHQGIEGMLQEIRDAFYKEYSGQTASPYIRATYNDHVIAEQGDKTLRIPYSIDGDKVKFGEPEEGDMVFVPKKQRKEAAKMAEDQKVKEGEKAPDAAAPAGRTYTEDEVAAIRAQADEAANKKFAKERDEISKAAVEAYKAEQARFSDRVRELDSIVPIEDEEREELEAKVKGADDLAYAKMLAERAKALAESSRKGKAHAAAEKDPAPKTLRGGAQQPGADKDPYRVSVPVN